MHSFTLHRVANANPSTCITRCFGGNSRFRENVFRSMRIGMLFVTTSDANEKSPRRAIVSRRVPTYSAHSRRVTRVNLDQRSATPVSFVSKLTTDLAPSNITDRAIESALGPDVFTRVFDVSFCASHHVTDLQCFDDDSTVVLGIAVRQLMLPVSSLISNLSINSRDAALSLCAAITSFPFTRQSSLRSSKFSLRLLEVSRIFDKSAIAIRDGNGNAHVESDGFIFVRMLGRWFYDFACDAHVPMIHILGQRDNLGRARDAPMTPNLQPSNLGKSDAFSGDTKTFGRTRSHCCPIMISSFFKAGEPLAFRKKRPPCNVDNAKQWLRKIRRNVTVPLAFAPKLGKLARLSIVCWPWSRLSTQTLAPLVGRRIPQRPQRVLPGIKPPRLLTRRIRAKAVGHHATAHGFSSVSITRLNSNLWSACGAALPGLKAEAFTTKI